MDISANKFSFIYLTFLFMYDILVLTRIVYANGINYSNIRPVSEKNKVWAALPDEMLRSHAEQQFTHSVEYQQPVHNQQWRKQASMNWRDNVKSKRIYNRSSKWKNRRGRKRHIATEMELMNCPKLCTCKHLKAECNYQELREIPWGFQRDIEKLSLIGNKISRLNSTAFCGTKNLRTLILTNNQISEIEKDTFTCLSKLKRLRLNRNRLTSIYKEMFRGMINLQKIDLRQNYLTCIHAGSFRGLSDLRQLYISHNRISWIAGDAFDERTTLRTLDLKENKFKCDCALLPLIERLLKAGNLLALHQSGGICHTQDDQTPIRFDQLPYVLSSKCVAEDDFQMEPEVCAQVQKKCSSLCQCSADGTVDCKNRRLTEIPSDLPMDMIELNLGSNYIRSLNSSSFLNYPNLRKMILDGNPIENIEPGTFAHLSNLNSLYISSNELRALPPGMFSGLKNLMILYLHRNKISCVEKDSFSGLQSLQILHLSENRIRTIPRGAFRDLKSLKYLYIVHNPLICDCRLHWMKNLLLEKEAGGNYWAKCAEPQHLQGSLIRDLKFDARSCNDSAKSCRSISSQCPKGCRCDELLVNPALENAGNMFYRSDEFGVILDGMNVDCSYAGFETIPEHLPENTKVLNLRGNQIKVLSRRNNLAGLLDLETINLDGNGLEHIEDFSLSTNTRLNKLILSNNSLVNVNENTFSGLENLEILLLQQNKLQCLGNKTFFNNQKLKVLMLNNNKIKCISKGIFAKSSLDSLSLTANPLVCDCHLSWLPDWLRDNAEVVVAGPLPPTCAQPEDLMGTPIASLARYHFNCPKVSQECLEEPGSTNTVCHRGCCEKSDTITQIQPKLSIEKCPTKCLCESDGVYCSDKNLTEIPSRLPVDTTQLYLERNHIREIKEESLAPLTKLHTLVLSYNHIEEIPARVFQNLQNLKTLVLSHNHIQCIHPDAFKGLQGLRVLILQGNNISLIPFGAFNELRELNNIALGQNPLHCDCNGKWLNSYFRQHFLDNGIALCHSPRTMRYKSIYHSKPGDFVCPWKQKMQSSLRNVSSLDFRSKVTDALLLDEHRGVMQFDDDEMDGSSTRGTSESFEEQESLKIISKCSPCLKNPCLNGGHCSAEGLTKYKCSCNPPYFGSKCELVENACAINPCQNGGLCELTPYSGTYQCHCPKNFRGTTCNERIDTCPQNYCRNGGICEQVGLDYRCHCPPEYKGKSCQYEVVPCEDVNPCLNGGICKRIPGNQYSCECQHGWIGKNCQTNQDDCTYNRCENGATCIDGVNEYICKCRPGYAGIYCERYTWNPENHITRMERRMELTQIGKTSTQVRQSPIRVRSLSLPKLDTLCSYHLCQNGAHCVEGQDGSYTCQCPNGFTGRYCENLYSISLPSSYSYIAIVPPSRGALVPQGSIEFNIRTRATSGLVLYYADHIESWKESIPRQYLLVYLLHGHVHVIYSLNSSQSAHLTSETTINDDFAHSLHLNIIGNQLNFTLDGHAQSHTAESHPNIELPNSVQSYLALTNPLYFGGAPLDRLDTASRIVRGNRTQGMTGCIENIRINDRLIDFARLFGAPVDKLTQTVDHQSENSSPEAKRYGTAIGILPGCGLAKGTKQVEQQAEVDDAEDTEQTHTESLNEACNNSECAQRNNACHKNVQRTFIRDPQTTCISSTKIALANCRGQCSSWKMGHSERVIRAIENNVTIPHQQCCQPSKTKHRRVWFHCADGTRYERAVKLIRRCTCQQCEPYNGQLD